VVWCAKNEWRELFDAVQKMRICWFLETFLKEAVSNHPLLLWSRAMVVSELGKGMALTVSGVYQRDERK